MRPCSECKETKPLEDFPRDKSKKLGRNYICRVCANDRQKAKKRELRKAVASLKTPCIFCGEDEPICIDWHHINPEDKSFSISRVNTSMGNILKEIEKCVCVCSNCHRRVHAGMLDLRGHTAG